MVRVLPGADSGRYPHGNSVLVEGDENFDHILDVDDSDVALRYIQTRLRRFGFKVHLERSGE